MAVQSAVFHRRGERLRSPSVKRRRNLSASCAARLTNRHRLKGTVIKSTIPAARHGRYTDRLGSSDNATRSIPSLSSRIAFSRLLT